MSKIRQKTSQQRKKQRIKQAINEKGRGRKIIVSRSNRYLYAQVVDIPSGKTLIGLSDKDLSKDLSDDPKIERALELGKELAQRMGKLGMKKAAFDRAGYLFHGRVESFVEGLRKGGIKI